MIYQFEHIRHLHLEISSKCNAACPLCPRTFWGYPYNQGYVEHNMTLLEAQTIFKPNFVKQLKDIVINGNFGDAVMNPHTADICRYFLEHNPNVHICISTNGGARSDSFWVELAQLGVEVFFCIDGLEDTHSIYRQNTLFSTVIKNAKTFIAAGGRAGWKMIKFEHNLHQIDQCQVMSKELGFGVFLLVDDGRDNGPVFNKDKELVYLIGPSKWGDSKNISFDVMLRGHTDPSLAENRQKSWVKNIPIKNITCEVAVSKSIYVSSTGDVFPCCYTGFNPRSYRNNSDHGYGMQQINEIMVENNALIHDLEHCIQWFDQISQSWAKNSFDQGRLVTCNQQCGGSLKIDTHHVREATLISHT